MSNLLFNILFGAIWIVVTTAIMGAAVRQPAKHSHSGEVRLAYGWFMRGFAIIAAFDVPILVVVLYFAGMINTSAPPTRSDSLAALTLALLFASFGGILFLESMCVRLTLMEEGIDMHSPWRPGRFIRWDEVTSIDFSNALQWFVVKDRHGQVIRLHAWLGGLIAFCDMARRRLDYSVIAGAMEGFRTVDEHAGRRTL